MVCKHLGYGFASDSFNTDIFGGQNSSSLILSGTVCQGNETKLSECTHQQFGSTDLVLEDDTLNFVFIYF